MSVFVPRAAVRLRQLLVAQPSIKRSAPVSLGRVALSGPSTSRRLSTTPSTWKKATKGSGSKASKPKSREEVENIDYENPKLDDALGKIGAKMEKAVDWAKTVVYESVERGRGRVSPSMLDSVKVTLPDQGTIPLNAVASVTIKQNTLFVEVWDTDASKHVESALHKANLPGLTPQKMGANTLKIPVPRPTGDHRAALAKTVATTIETAKQQVRLARTDGLKAVGGKGETGADEVQELANKWGGELDTLATTARKELEKP